MFPFYRLSILFVPAPDKKQKTKKKTPDWEQGTSFDALCAELAFWKEFYCLLHCFKWQLSCWKQVSCQSSRNRSSASEFSFYCRVICIFRQVQVFALKIVIPYFFLMTGCHSESLLLHFTSDALSDTTLSPFVWTWDQTLDLWLLVLQCGGKYRVQGPTMWQDPEQLTLWLLFFMEGCHCLLYLIFFFFKGILNF